MIRVVGVHGVGNHRAGEPWERAAERLGAVWGAALDRGARAAASRGRREPRLHEVPAPEESGHEGPGYEAPCQEVPVPGESAGEVPGHNGPGHEVPGHNGPGHEVRVAYYADLLHATGRQAGPADLDGLDPFERELLSAWLSALPLPEAVAAGRATWVPRQVVSWLARTRFPGAAATEWFVATFVREVATYLRTDSRVRASVRERVARVIAAHRADVVIAHSLGSVVAYEALWSHPGPRVPALITLGSPLALPHAVFHRLDPTPAPCGDPPSSVLRGARPPRVEHWTNLADPGDIVAVPPYGVGRAFRGVDVDAHTVISAFDFHRVRNYLAAPQVAHALRRGGRR